MLIGKYRDGHPDESNKPWGIITEPAHGRPTLLIACIIKVPLILPNSPSI